MKNNENILTLTCPVCGKNELIECEPASGKSELGLDVKVRCYECPTCKNKFVECPDCNGSGYTTSIYREYDDCETCQGMGMIPLSLLFES